MSSTIAVSAARLARIADLSAQIADKVADRSFDGELLSLVEELEDLTLVYAVVAEQVA